MPSLVRRHSRDNQWPSGVSTDLSSVLGPLTSNTKPVVKNLGVKDI